MHTSIGTTTNRTDDTQLNLINMENEEQTALIHALKAERATCIKRISSINEILDTFKEHKISNGVIFENVISIVCSAFKVTVEEIKGRSRQGDVSQARHIAIHFINKYTVKMSLTAIGIEFERDHATIIHSINVVSNLSDIDKAYRNNLIEIEKLINIENSENKN